MNLKTKAQRPPLCTHLVYMILLCNGGVADCMRRAQQLSELQRMEFESFHEVTQLPIEAKASLHTTPKAVYLDYDL